MTREIKFRAWDEKRKVMIPNITLAGLKNWEGVNFYQWMQFTGLKDKTGKEIYEGDIVKFRSHPNPAYIGEIKWSQEYARFMIVYFKDDFEREKNYPSTHSFGHENQLEIIGNIYENPELLK